MGGSNHDWGFAKLIWLSPRKLVPPAIFPDKVNGTSVFPAVGSKNFGALRNASFIPYIWWAVNRSWGSSSSISTQNLPLLTMSFAVTLVQATITTCPCPCYSLLMLPPSVITVPGGSLLKGKSRTSLVAQWLRLWAPTAGDPGSILGQGTRSHMPQLKIPCDATKIQPGHSQINI